MAARQPRGRGTNSPKKKSVVGINHGHGCILICDIVGFSRKPEEVQVACVEFLNEQWKQECAALGLGANIYTNCTGDGFIAALPLSISFDHKVSADIYDVALNLSKRLIQKCADYNKSNGHPSLEVRFGMHKGDYRAPVHAFGGNHVIGTGPNHTARVVQIADQSQIVVSEEFFKRGGDRPVGAWTELFSGPARVPIKHDQTAIVYVYRGDAVRDWYVHRESPKRIQYLEWIDGRVLALLEGLSAVLEEHLSKFIGEDSELDSRLSVFVEDEGQMVCTEYRFHSDKGKENPGTTTYALSDPPEGAIGLAYKSGEPVIVTALPNAKNKKGMDPYVDAWLQEARNRGFTMTSEHIRGDGMRPAWGRRPRALIAVPFNVDGKGRGVLCVDTRHPLGPDIVPPDQVEGVAVMMQQRLSSDMAWCLHVRRGS